MTPPIHDSPCPLCFLKHQVRTSEGWTWTNHRAWWTTPGLGCEIRRRCWLLACCCRSPVCYESSAGHHASWEVAARARGSQIRACRWCARPHCASPPWSGHRKATRKGSRRGSSCVGQLAPGTATEGWWRFHPAWEQCTHCKHVVMGWQRRHHLQTHSSYSSNTDRGKKWEWVERTEIRTSKVMRWERSFTNIHLGFPSLPFVAMKFKVMVCTLYSKDNLLT